jgi:hypothetical protein
VESVAFAYGFDDAAAVGEAVEGGADESFGAEDFGPRTRRQVRGDDHRGAFVGGRYDVEERFGADFRDRDVAEFVEHQQIESRELGLEPEEGPFVAGPDQGGDEFGGAEESDLVSAGAGFQRPVRSQWVCRCREWWRETATSSVGVAGECAGDGVDSSVVR